MSGSNFFFSYLFLVEITKAEVATGLGVRTARHSDRLQLGLFALPERKYLTYVVIDQR